MPPKPLSLLPLLPLLLLLLLLLRLASPAFSDEGLKRQVPAMQQHKGICTSSPLLIAKEDISCRSGLDAPDAKVGQRKLDREGTARTGSPASSDETGWSTPRHCMQEYCVYSNRAFSGGITVITTAENARRISGLPAVTRTSSEPAPFYAAEVSGKGVGLVANRTIKRGERIMMTQPTYVTHRRMTDDLSVAEQHRILDAALLQLPAARRRAFSRQLGQFGGHRVSDILLTNAFQLDVGGGDHDGHHLGNFPDVSRFNHDCRPNVAFYIDRQLAHHTHAVRDIAAGEELTLAYMNPFEERAERQRHMRESWGFTCTCRHCSMTEAAARTSDARLREIDAVEAQLGDFASTAASPAMVGRLLQLYEAERLDVKLHGAYVLAALNYNLAGDADKAARYASLAVDAGLAEFGPDAADVEAMRTLAQDPKTHFTWRKRVVS